MGRTTRYVAPVAALGLAILVFVTAGRTSSQERPMPATGEVHGYVSVAFTSGDVRVPDAAVRLRNVDTGVDGPIVRTNAHGWFDTTRHANGRYRACASAFGISLQCDTNVIMLAGETVVLPDDVRLVPAPRTGHGQAVLDDDSACYGENLSAQPVEVTRVTLLDLNSGAPLTAPTIANSRGQFILGTTPAARVLVRAECEGANAVRSVDFSNNSGPAASAVALRFSNRPPRFLGMSAHDFAGAVVRYPNGGDVVTVTANASDPDGDKLHYEWTAATGKIVACDMPSIDWRLPTESAMNSLYVRVTDGRGGVARGSVRLPTGASPLFSGTVIDAETSTPIANAAVTVNGGATARTRSDGGFLVSTTPANRYVLNVTQNAYAMSSQIFADARTQLVIPLSRATRFLCNPGLPCSGEQRAGAGGMTLALPAGALVNTAGAAATVPVRIDILAYDLGRPNAIPGQNELTGRNGQSIVRLTSFGAFSVNATDAAGQRYNLRPNMPARVTLIAQSGNSNRRRRTVRSNTSDRNQLPPATIPLWRYEEASGMWVRAGGVGQLNAAGSYEFEIPTFSDWNADLEFTTASCMHVTVDESTTSYPFRARFDVGGTIVEQLVTDNDNILRLLPPSTPITLEIHPVFGPDKILKTYSLNSGPATPDLSPVNYGDCNGFDLGTGTKPVVISLGGIPASHDSSWLSRKTPGGISIATESTAYYTNIGAIPAKDTLTKWKSVNGFPAGEVAAVYYNAGDLGFGRQMHCRQSGGNVACYVTNFGTGPGGPADLAVQNAATNTSPIATVAMEFTPPASAPNSVKFYVFDGAGVLSTTAVLDGEGPKPVPFICLVCHGGDYNDSTSAVNPASVIGASFREFDVFTFLYHRTNPVFQYAAQAEAFRQLNAMVYATSPAYSNLNQPITKLIDGMYPAGVTTPGAAAVNTFVPTDWSTRPALYEKVPRQFCRACHIAQSSSLDWSKSSQFTTFSSSIAYAVCTSHDMPHAEVPFKKFWLSDAPAYLSDSVTGIGKPPGGCPP